MAKINTLLVSEIFLSIQGEGSRAGWPCSFVRLAGCDVGCTWCDTLYAHSGGVPMEQAQVLEQIGKQGTLMVEVTGGEPLCQEGARPLLEALCDAGYEVLIETSGTMDMTDLDERVVRIMDVKGPSSGVVDKMYWENLKHLRPEDEIKFPIADRQDYDFAKDVMKRYDLNRQCTVLMGVVAPRLALAELVKWILDDHLLVRLNVQLHKVIWPAEDRGR